MSKVSFSRELLGTIKFVFDKTKSRTLNATQAYDTSPSQIVLASYPAKASIKAPAKSLGKVLNSFYNNSGTAALKWIVTGYQFSEMKATGNKVEPEYNIPVGRVEFWYHRDLLPSSKVEDPDGTIRAESVVSFTGTLADGLLDSSKRKSNANKDIFYGAITVGTGLYKEWQGKYAVLKVDLLTNNAILRVYNR